MSLQQWAEEFAALEPADSEWDWRGRRGVFAERLSELVEEREAVALSESQWDRLAATAAWTASNILWDDEESISFRLDLIDRLSALVAQVAVRTPTEHYGTRMFWDVIAIHNHGIDIAALPGIAFETRSTDATVAEALFQALARQLRIPQKQTQLSALQGLRQLGDPRTPGLVESTHQDLFDAEVRAIAAAAARFDLI